MKRGERGGIYSREERGRRVEEQMIWPIEKGDDAAERVKEACLWPSGSVSCSPPSFS